MGHIQLIQSNNLDEDCRDENLEGLQVAIDSGNLLLNIIEDILDLSKIEAGQLDIVENPINVRQMVKATMDLANAYGIQRKKDHIQLSETVDERISDFMLGDQFRVQQGMVYQHSNLLPIVYVIINKLKPRPPPSIRLCSIKQSCLKCYQGT